MDYADVVRNLVATAKSCGVAYTLDVPSEPNDIAFSQTVFGARTCRNIRGVGYPSMEVPWPVESFFLYPIIGLSSRQAGYRYDARTMVLDTQWDEGKYVIGDWAADPVSVDASGVVWHSIHGEGTWRSMQVAENTEQFLDTLARWMNYFVIDRGGRLFEDDVDEVSLAEKQDIVSDVLREHREHTAVNFLNLLLR